MLRRRAGHEKDALDRRNAVEDAEARATRRRFLLQVRSRISASDGHGVALDIGDGAESGTLSAPSTNQASVATTSSNAAAAAAVALQAQTFSISVRRTTLWWPN